MVNSEETTMELGSVKCNNPGRIPLTASPFRGEQRVERGETFAERYSIELKPQAGIKQFKSMAWGYRAMFLMLHNFGQIYSLRSASSLIRRWSRGRSVNINDYVEVVTKRLKQCGWSVIDTKNREQMIELVSTMSRFENGTPAKPQDVRAGWKLFEESLRYA